MTRTVLVFDDDLRACIHLMVVTAVGRAPQKAARIGAEGYLAKPFTLDAFREQVQRLAPP